MDSGRTSRFTHHLMRLSLACLLVTATPISVRAVDQKQGEATQGGKRPVTVADAILMTKLGDRIYYRGGEPKDGVAQFSRDGKKFIVIVRRGNLDANANEYSLLLWSTSDALKSRPPEVVLTMASTSNREAIQSVT